MRIDDPWHRTPADGWLEEREATEAAEATAAGGAPPAGPRTPAGNPTPLGRNDPPPGRNDPPPGRNDPPHVPPAGPAAADAVHVAVQHSPAFRRVRARHRGFVLPAGAALLLVHLATVVPAAVAPELAAHRVAGPLDAGTAAGLAQLVVALLVAGAYARHARLRRDRTALELRWDTQELVRGAGECGR
ncbi:DUF485 domain-containing protein [Streptomyces sp. JJ36]|uniref:DUF485 domain-containing protein n=1 Tax=Streptomyces sp. JJ36 TaxID=2736645 RepID=UPI001F2E8F6B|nr:DUF485 domain-containing protein [Streptomyces sp. JJ36]MCF6522764.1 DUF485 domain-containing protein [Streptomyces sp. JJ36]